MAKACVYLDSSAYIAALIGEPGHGEFLRHMDGAVWLSSVLLVAETGRSLLRLARHGHLSSGKAQEALRRLEGHIPGILLREVSLDLCDSRVFPAVSTPGTMDLIHLRTAVWFHEREPITRFLTADGPQKASAEELGLPI